MEEYDFAVIDWANAGFLILIRARVTPAFRNYTLIMLLANAFNFNKSEHVIKLEAGVALSAILQIQSLWLLNESKELKDSKNAKKQAEVSANIQKIIMRILSNKKPLLCTSAQAVFAVLNGGDAEIKEIKDFKDEAFALLLNDLKKTKSI